MAWPKPGGVADRGRASDTDAEDGTSQTVPPLKSMEKLRPWVASEISPTRMMTAEIPNH